MTCSHLNASLLFLSDCGILKSTSDHSFYDYCCIILFILYLACIVFVPIFHCTIDFCSSISIVIGWLVGWGLTALLTQNRSYRACKFVGIFEKK